MTTTVGKIKELATKKADKEVQDEYVEILVDLNLQEKNAKRVLNNIRLEKRAYLLNMEQEIAAIKESTN